MDSILLWLLGFAAALALLYVITDVGTNLRDLFVNQGWVSERSRLARMTRRAQTGRFKVFLDILGLDEGGLAAYRVVGDPITKHARRLGVEVSTRPDVSFLRRVDKWTYRLDAPYTYRGSDYYVDMMGAVYWRESHETALEQIVAAWLAILLDRHVLDPFHCVLALKDGNSLLGRNVAEVARKHLIICKGANDRSLVGRPAGDAPHETDFEGLRALQEHEKTVGSQRLFPHRAVIIDDSCAGGSQIVSATQRFNQHVIEKKLSFHPVHDVVVLFRVKDSEGNVDDADLAENGLRLHALLALGPEEFTFLHESGIEKAIEQIDQFKEDPFSCEHSKRLLTKA